MTHEPVGGDDACWLQHVCPDCGAMPEPGATACWRCGRAIGADDGAPPADPAAPHGIEGGGAASAPGRVSGSSSAR